MDQLKEIIKQAIKYRFWIAVGLSALLPLIAYFVGSGSVKAKAAAETAKIEGASKNVKQYMSGTLPNGQYKGIVGERTDELSKDVNESWKKLYARQAPLLTWPDRVQERFTKWGRKWPEGVDVRDIQIAIIDYVTVYPNFVTEVYNSFKPFDPIEGSGVVSAPPEAALLRPATFTIEAPPSLGKVWAAQERLWIQRTLLDVVAQVNKDAKDWDSSIVRQVNLLEVGNPDAQDQRSRAKGETLEEDNSIKDPNKPDEPAADATTTASEPGSMAGALGRAGMMPGMSGMGGNVGATESVYYIHTDSQQFKVLPVEMSVLIDQSRIQDFLIALENSPMTIQVMDFEMSKPQAPVVKPIKGEQMSYMGMGMMGPMGEGMMPGMDGMMRGMTGYGGRFQMMRGMMDSAMMSMPGSMGGMPGMMGYGMGGGTAKKGIDKRAEDRRKKQEEQLKAIKSAIHTSIHDPYFNIIEVKIYGQARFFNPPPAETPTEPSQAGETPTPAPAAEAEKKAEAEVPKTETEAKPDAEPKKAEAAKEETPKPEAEKKAEPSKDEKEKPGAEKKAEPPKAEAPKADAPKAGDAGAAPK
jgi:hypothetical protein